MTPHLIEKLKITRSKAVHKQHRLSAIILKKNKVISMGSNHQEKTHPAIKQWSTTKTCHAEFVAISRVKNRELLNKATIVTYRETKDGNLANSRPCEACISMLKYYGFKYMIYSTDNGKFFKEKLKTI